MLRTLVAKRLTVSRRNMQSITKLLGDVPTYKSRDELPPPKITKSEEEWKKQFKTDLQYTVLRKQGTEYAFSGVYHDHKDKGVYKCAGCGTPLFKSEAKYEPIFFRTLTRIIRFDSGCGWPSFFEPITKERYVF